MWWPSVFNISSYISWFGFSSLYQKIDTKSPIKVISYEKGDIVQNFKLESRLETLGLPTFYIRDDNWKFAIQSDSGTAIQKFEESSLVANADGSYVVLLDDSRIKFQEECVQNGSFCVHENIFHGGHGEIWRAYRIRSESGPNGDSSGTSSGVNRSVSYILKRMRVKDRPEILQCALREIVFGELLLQSQQSDPHLMFARYVSYFVSPDLQDYWLVFLDEGMSLQQTMYATVYSNHNALLMPSQLWRNMRTTPSGEVTLKGILYQLLTAVERLHALNITHRDLKPSNILLNVEDKLHPRLLVADFSSAMQTSLMDSLYASNQPSIAEETLLYAPPEVLLSINTSCGDSSDTGTTSGTAAAAGGACPARGDAFYADLPTSYDMWSVGVIYLELLLGTADVFALDDRSVNIITQKLRRKGLRDADSLSQAVLLAGLSEYCIFNPGEVLLGEDDGNTRGGGGSGGASGGGAFSAAAGSSGGDLPVPHSVASLSDASLDGKQLSPYSQTTTTATSTSSSSSSQSGSLLLALDYLPASHKKKHFDTSSSSSASSSSTGSYDSSASAHSHVACLSKAILRRDPLGRGFTGLWGLDLLSRLLRFDPLERITARQALGHAYFAGPYVSDLDGSEHGTQEDLDTYNLMLLEGLEGLDSSSSSSGGGESGESLEQQTVDEVVHLVVDSSSSSTIGGTSDDRSSGAAGVGGGEYHHPIYLAEQLRASTSGTPTSETTATAATAGKETDKRISNNQHALVTHLIENTDFVCPRCGRVFRGDYSACLKHTKSRGHGLHCEYSTHSLPPCLSEHALQPVDPQSGWCDLQGTRQYIEDVHVLYYDDYFNFFGVFDGHFGPNAAKFASKHIYGLFHQFVHSYLDTRTSSDSSAGDADAGPTASVDDGDVLQYGERDIRLSSWLNGSERLTSTQLVQRQRSLLADIPYNTHSKWQEAIQPVTGSEAVLLLQQSEEVGRNQLTSAQLMQFLADSFLLTHNQLVYRHDQGMELSGGCTATSVVLLQGQYLLIAHVGDSRVIACCAESSGNSSGVSEQQQQLLPVQLTLDHTPYSSSERQRVVNRGGWVDEGGSVWRVNGQLAVTRSLGDPALRSVLSAAPDVLMFRYKLQSSTDADVPLLTSSSSSSSGSTVSRGNANHCYYYKQEVRSFFPSSGDLLFVVVGSDGLWDVMTNLEVSEFVCEYLLERRSELKGHTLHSNKFLPIDSFHEISKLLAYEALVRGSSDNIGVNVIDLLDASIG